MTHARVEKGFTGKLVSDASAVGSNRASVVRIRVGNTSWWSKNISECEFRILIEEKRWVEMAPGMSTANG